MKGSSKRAPNAAVIAAAMIAGGVCVAVGLRVKNLPAPLVLSDEWRGVVGLLGMVLLGAACIGVVARSDFRG